MLVGALLSSSKDMASSDDTFTLRCSSLDVAAESCGGDAAAFAAWPAKDDVVVDFDGSDTEVSSVFLVTCLATSKGSEAAIATTCASS